MSFDDWIIALHVLSAFSLVAGSILFWAVIWAVRQIDTPADTLRLGPLAKVGNATVGVGLTGTIFFGVWLAFALDGYEIWDGWIVAGIVLWFIGAGLGRQIGVEYMKGTNKAEELEKAGHTGTNAELLAINRTSRGVLFHALTSAVVILILIDMIWKPGA